jgi:hypothetical protein
MADQLGSIRRRTPEQIFNAAVEKVERARERRATHLNLGERRRSLRRLPSLAGLTSLQDFSIIDTGITDLDPLLELPALTSLNLSGTPVWNLSPLSKLTQLRSLLLRMTNVIDLTPLARLSNLRFLALDGTPCADLRPLSNLSNLTTLLLSRTEVSDLTSIKSLVQLETLDLSSTKVVDISSLYEFSNLSSLNLNQTAIKSVSPLFALKKLRNLNVSNTFVSDLSPLSALAELEDLNVAKTSVTNLSPLARLSKLQTLLLDFAPITDLGPLANVKFLSRKGHYFFDDEGLSFAGCPVSDPVLGGFAKIHNPERSILAINHVRIQQGLIPFTEEECLRSDREYLPEHSDSTGVQPLENIASAFDFRLSSGGIITLTSSPSNWPIFPHKGSQHDHAVRLEACRTLAIDLISDLTRRKFQARGEYVDGLRRYSSRLPAKPGEGNIFLAEAEARTLRNLFAAEANILPPPFASKLKTFIEQHMGLRVFYPEIGNFYRDVQTGRIETPLSLDAVEGFIRGVSISTPTVFDPSVNESYSRLFL